GLQPVARLLDAARVRQDLTRHQVHRQIVGVQLAQLDERGEGVVRPALAPIFHGQPVPGEGVGLAARGHALQKGQALVHAEVRRWGGADVAGADVAAACLPSGSSPSALHSLSVRYSSKTFFGPKPLKRATTLSGPSVPSTMPLPKRRWNTRVPRASPPAPLADFAPAARAPANSGPAAA